MITSGYGERGLIARIGKIELRVAQETLQDLTHTTRRSGATLIEKERKLMTGVIYQKTQRATLILALLTLAFFGVVFAAMVSSSLVWIVGLVLAVAAYLFSSLTIRVDEKVVEWHFGPGFLRKSISLAEIADVESVRNKWWYGWGIRYTPHGWLYNVSGFDAIQVRLTNGKVVRLGTDEPTRLCQAIKMARGEP